MINPSAPDFQNTPVSIQRPTFDYAPGDPPGEPYVSIVTPFFNTGAVFHDTALSVLNQSFQQWEWLIVNDGSTNPEAQAILDEYRRLDPRVRVIDRGVNGGPGAARNTGFDCARAAYIVQLDSDNLLEPTAVETWLWFLESHPEYGFVKGLTVGFGAQEYLWTGGFHDGPAFLYKNNIDATAMIRKEVHKAAGGYDESIRDGFEDWEFWLRCANAGYWGGTVLQFLDWYRRRPTHTDRWKDWDGGSRQQGFLQNLRRRYPGLWNGGFPRLEARQQFSSSAVLDRLPCENRLGKVKPRLLMILPWLTMGGADRFNLSLLKQLCGHGWEVTIATTLESDHSWQPEFAAHTPDIFVLHRFLNLVDYPRFLLYLAQSRQVDAVLISHSELAYHLLPFFRANLPEVALLDYCHIEEEQWKNGGYPRLSLQYQESLDLQIVSSQHLKDWMAGQGNSADRIRVCYTNIDVPPQREDRSSPHPALQRERPLRILYAGRICEQKQPRGVARTCLRLAQQGMPFRAAVAGEGPDLKWLEAFLKQHQLSRQVQLLGEVPVREMGARLAEADIFFLPSLWEGISLAIYEAMASGLVIVGADVGGQSELVTPECGFLVPPGDGDTQVEQYAAILMRLILEPGLAKQMGAAGRERIAAGFRLDQMGDQMVELIQEARELCASQPRARPSHSLARAFAAQTVEYVRISRLADRLWMERHGHSVSSDQALYRSLQELNWRKRLYLKLYQWHEPLYHWYSRRNWSWLAPVRGGVKKVLLRS